MEQDYENKTEKTRVKNADNIFTFVKRKQRVFLNMYVQLQFFKTNELFFVVKIKYNKVARNLKITV